MPKKAVRKKFRRGTRVHVADVELLRKSFYSWPKNQVFTVRDDSVTNQRWVWVDSYSCGLPPEALTIATKAQRNAVAEPKVYGY